MFGLTRTLRARSNGARAAGDNATLWEIPESKHVGGIEARPREYERRVVGFFNEALM